MIGPATPARRRTLAASVAYDMALHGYALMIPAVGYALHFTSFVAAGEARANLLWSTASSPATAPANTAAATRWRDALRPRSGRCSSGWLSQLAASGRR